MLAAVDAALAAGELCSTIADKYHLSAQSLRRHKANGHAQRRPGREQLAPAEPQTLVEQTRAAITQTEQLTIASLRAHDVRGALSAARERGRLLSLLHTLTSPHPAVAEVHAERRFAGEDQRAFLLRKLGCGEDDGEADAGKLHIDIPKQADFPDFRAWNDEVMRRLDAASASAKASSE